MVCKEKHEWVHIYSEADSDYEPSTTIWWCASCGQLLKRSEYDGRTVRQWNHTPKQMLPSAT